MTHDPHAEQWLPGFKVEGSQSGTIVAAKSEASGSNLPFWSLMIFLFITMVSPQGYIPALHPFRLALLSAVAAIASQVFERTVYGKQIKTKTSEMTIITCLIGWALLTIPLSMWPGGSMELLLGRYIKSIAAFWLLANIVSTLPRFRAVAWGLSLMVVPMAAYGVNEYLSGRFALDEGVMRIRSLDSPLASNPNDLALMLNLILPFVVALFLMNHKPILRAVLLGIMGLLVGGVIITFSRAGFLTLVTIFVVYQLKLLRRPQGGLALLALLIMLVSIPLLPSGYLDRLGTISDIDADTTGSAQGRWGDMHAAVNVVVKNPVIGAGIGNDILALNEQRGAYWTAVHNVYLQYAVDLGVPGAILFLLLLIGCIKSATFVTRRCAGEPAFQELFYLAEAVQVSLFGFIVAAMFYPIAYHLHFFMIGGLAVAAKLVYEAEGQTMIPSLGGAL